MVTVLKVHVSVRKVGKDLIVVKWIKKHYSVYQIVLVMVLLT